MTSAAEWHGWLRDAWPTDPFRPSTGWDHRLRAQIGAQSARRASASCRSCRARATWPSRRAPTCAAPTRPRSARLPLATGDGAPLLRAHEGGARAADAAGLTAALFAPLRGGRADAYDAALAAAVASAPRVSLGELQARGAASDTVVLLYTLEEFARVARTPSCTPRTSRAARTRASSPAPREARRRRRLRDRRRRGPARAAAAARGGSRDAPAGAVTARRRAGPVVRGAVRGRGRWHARPRRGPRVCQ